MSNPIIFSKHALQQMAERGAFKEEVEEAILKGERTPAKKGRYSYRLNFQYGKNWGEKWYHIKQVMPIVINEGNHWVVITVYVFYF